MARYYPTGVKIIVLQRSSRFWTLASYGDVRDVVVDRHESTVCAPDFPAGVPQSLESLGRSDLVDEVTIDIQQGIALARVDDMVIKDLVVQRAWLRSGGRHI